MIQMYNTPGEIYR